jgi:thiol-disulfide isomerase/thioredoxin
MTGNLDFINRGAVRLAAPLLAAAFATSAAAQNAANFVLHGSPRPLPEITFVDGAGATRRLADFRGAVVLLNLWATWCAPCRQEMPTLESLQATLGGSDFAVVALSIDRGGLPVAREFYEQLGLRALPLYVDPTAQAARALGAFGLPLTLLIDRAGNEIGRLIGPAEWDSPEMLAFLRPYLERPSGVRETTPGRGMASYAFVVGTGLLRAEEPSPNWTTLGNDFGAGVLLHLAVDPTDADKLYAVTRHGEVLSGTDAGRSWSAFGTRQAGSRAPHGG